MSAKLALRILAIALMVVMFVPVSPAGAITVGEGGGCTPGFWKNHQGAWEEYSPSDPISVLLLDFPAELQHLESFTLIQALNWGGGPTLEDAAKNLLKHTVTAYLNSAHDDVPFPFRRFGTGVGGRPSLQSLVSNALLSLDRETMLDVKDTLDEANNANCTVRNPNRQRARRK